MIFIDKMKNMKIYKTQTFFPTLKKDKKKGSAILMMTPNYESSKRLMNHPMFVNSGRYISYFLEKDVSYYINSKVVEDIEENAIQYLNETKRADLPDSAFGLPEERKYPLDTAEHVKSAIRLFGHCPEDKKHELAVRIMAAAKKFDIEVKETTQVYKYAHQESTNESASIPKYHIIYAELDQYYTMWKNGTMSESVAKKNILRIMKNNLCLDNNATIDDVPSISEYYSNRGGTYVSEDVYTDEKILTETLLRNLPSDTLNTGDKVLFFNEANATDSQLKRL